MISINDLHVSFRTENKWIEAVKDVSFNLARGEILGIVGESGSGKSVTALTIMRLLDTRAAKISGSINFRGTDLLSLAEKQMRAYRGNMMSMVFQEPMTSLNPVLTCGDQVTEAMRQHFRIGKTAAKQKVIELFKEVQLIRPKNVYDCYPHQLSGGQKQRVMIAMALSCDPEVLIADEPTTALDVTVQKTILQVLLNLRNKRNMSIIFISHDLGVIGEIADQVAVMYKGKIVEKASVAELFSNPQHPYTKGLLACRPSPERKLKKLPVIADFLKVNMHGKIESTNETISHLINSLKFNYNELADRKEKIYSQKPILKVKNLKTWHPIKTGLFSAATKFVKAVNDVSFEVFPGETLGLVGESGCGKTTLGRSILKLVELTAGKIIFKGTDITKFSENEMRIYRKNIQIIFQDPSSSLNPRLTVGQSIIEPMLVHGIYATYKQCKERVISLLERVNLKPEHFNRYPHEFSGGQKQRVSIARALALQPEFIICDESVSALDVSVQAQILNLLRELQQELGLTYIFISHDLAVIKHISDRIIVMNKGKIIEVGDSEDIYNNPKQEYTQKLINAIPKGAILLS